MSDKDLQDLYQQIEAVQALCELPPSPFGNTESDQLDGDSVTFTPSGENGEQSLQHSQVSPLPFPELKHEDSNRDRVLNDSSDTLSPKSCQKCEKLENELASLKISHDTIAKRNAELSSKMRALSENELTGPKINSAPSVSGSFHTFGYPTPSSLGTAAANEEIRETGKFNVSSNGLAESSIFNFDGANDLLLQQSETRLSVGQFKQVQGELHLAQENFKRMKSFYIQEKKLNERLQQTAKEILNMNLKSEDKVSALQEQLRQSELENQRLQDRLDAYLSLPAVANISTAQRRISTSAALSDTFLQQHSSGSTTSPRSSTLKLGTFSERRSRVMTNAGAQYYPDLASTPRPYNSKHSNAPMSEKALGYTVAESSASTPSVENKLKVLRDSLDAEMAKSDKLIAAVDRSVT